MVESDSTDAESMQRLGILGQQIGSIHARRGEWDEALAGFRQYLDAHEKLVELAPTIAPLHRHVGSAWYMIGTALGSQGKKEEAKDAYTKSIEVFDRPEAEIDTAPPDVVNTLHDGVAAKRATEEGKAQAQKFAAAGYADTLTARQEKASSKCARVLRDGARRAGILTRRGPEPPASSPASAPSQPAREPLAPRSRVSSALTQGEPGVATQRARRCALSGLRTSCKELCTTIHRNRSRLRRIHRLGSHNSTDAKAPSLSRILRILCLLAANRDSSEDAKVSCCGSAALSGLRGF
jgi:hypothetical protein